MDLIHSLVAIFAVTSFIVASDQSHKADVTVAAQNFSIKRPAHACHNFHQTIVVHQLNKNSDHKSSAASPAVSNHL